MRFPLEVLRAVRKQVGPDFPILFRYSMEEFMPGGIDMEKVVRIAKELGREIATPAEARQILSLKPLQ